jgi:hypothetical protein
MSVLGPEASHLLLIRTILGYGTVLTAACAIKAVVPLIIIIVILCLKKCNVITVLYEAELFRKTRFKLNQFRKEVITFVNPSNSVKWLS